MSLVNNNNVEQYYLNDLWSLKFHDSFDNDWSKRSYKQLYEISTIQNFWEVDYFIKDKVDIGMFFLCREHVFPLWDDESNVNGGALSMKVLKTEAYQCWLDLSIKLLSETLLKPQHRTLSENVLVLSISSKKTFCIIKIWVKNDELSKPDMFDIPQKYHGKVLYSSWKTAT